jgi:hypothetical protein
MEPLDNGKRDRRSLPLGLKRYRPGAFDKLHACGSGVRTSSQVPGMLGQSRRMSPYALAAHISGKAPLPDVPYDAIRWGKAFQRAILEEVAVERPSWTLENLDAWAAHPAFDRAISSPDAAAWAPDKEGPGPGEIKFVTEDVFKRYWEPPPGDPALEAELQHQDQLACTGAAWGFIACFVMGFGRKLHIYETTPNSAAAAMILDETRALFALLDKGLLPPPDDHPASIEALHRIYPQTDPGKIVTLSGPEAEKRFTTWQQAKLDRKAAEANEEASENWFTMLDPEAGEFRIGNDKAVKVKVINVKGRTQIVDAYSYRKFELTPK